MRDPIRITVRRFADEHRVEIGAKPDLDQLREQDRPFEAAALRGFVADAGVVLNDLAYRAWVPGRSELELCARLHPVARHVTSETGVAFVIAPWSADD